MDNIDALLDGIHETRKKWKFMPMVLDADDIVYVIYLNCFFGGVTFYTFPILSKCIGMIYKEIKSGSLSAAISQIICFAGAALGYVLFILLIKLFTKFEADLLILYVFAPVGLMGWAIILFKNRKIFVSSWTRPRFLLQDLLIFVLMYSMSVASAGWFGIPVSKNASIVFPYLLIAMPIGMLIFIDYCKVARQEMEQFRVRRMLFELLILALATFPGCMLVAIFGWFLWRRAKEQ